MEYLYEMHAHTKEVSNCAVATAKDLVESYKGTEYKGIVLTNHLNEMTFKRIHMEDASWDEKIDHFLSGYKILKKVSFKKHCFLPVIVHVKKQVISTWFL